MFKRLLRLFTCSSSANLGRDDDASVPERLRDPLERQRVDTPSVDRRDRRATRLRRAYEDHLLLHERETSRQIAVKATVRTKKFRALTEWVDKHRDEIVESLRDDSNPNAMRKVNKEPRDLLFFKNGEVYMDLGQIGKGGFKTVHEIVGFDDQQVYAELKANGDDVEKYMKRELDAYASLKGKPGVTSILHRGEQKTADGKSSVSMVQKVYAGALTDYKSILRTRAGKLDFALDVMTGLKSLHDAGWMHRDIKPDNLLVGHDGSGAVTDFGLSTQTAYTWAGTRSYMHPMMALTYKVSGGTRAIPDKATGQRFDTFALGLALTQLFDPVEATKPRQLNRAIQNTKGKDAATIEASIQDYCDAHAAVEKRLKATPSTQPEQLVLHEMRNPDDLAIEKIDHYIGRMKAIRSTL